jgi:hypothetical protein
MAKRLLAQESRAAIWIARVVVALSLLSTLAACAPSQDVRYFEETGHNVSGAFLQFFDAQGGLSTFGYPLTREFEKEGRIVQCFQRLCLERPSPGADASTVETAMLGNELEYRQSSIAVSEIPPSTHPDKRYYEETGHTIGFAFLEFYDGNGGQQLFGYPITEQVVEPSGRIVQYFERSKMEWHPENPAGLRVRLGMLGTIYVEELVDPAVTEPESPLIILRTPTATALSPVEASSASTDLSGLQIIATLEHPIIGLGDEQRVYVYVVDPANRGVPGASVEMEVRYGDGKTEHISLAATNVDGHSEVDFPIGNPTPGRPVLIDLSARYGGLLAQSSTSFLPWW